ncbi:hypothetical protein C9F11_18555 [Streptomyces sp. YIM 121038]|uniref:DUF418 domain-containing protein n=1 Tax=Streptomyces sp. YIM 121038 TaxID=2136401 RepID=UPI001110EA29|nr:DUF418 domain-containing protein [Streptomyces sp. YIM 121038]QCX77363.1 hypothetical protein C9F11_18555 [Streptomyces sp. YIM 121038]
MTVMTPPTRATERALAPDVARGLMLLLIALSNTAFHLWRAEHGPSGWQPVDGSWLDHVVQFLMIMTLDLRIYPLFAFLFGYGMTQMYLRQTGHGTSGRAAVGVLRRRSLWMVVIGLAHSALLMAGDIIGFYGVLSLVLGWVFVRRSDRALKWWIWIGVAQTLLLTLAPVVAALLRGELWSLGDSGAEPGYLAYGADENSWPAAAGTRVTTGLFITFGASLLSLVGGGYLVFLLGFWAARRRILEEPGRHLPLLRRTAVIGVAVGWLGALPAALAHVGAIRVPDDAQSEGGALTTLRDLTGTAGGIGYVAAIALFVVWWTNRSPRPGATAVAAVAAVGKRSMSCYLTHSLLFAPLLAAWGLGLGAHLSSATMALVATAVWLVTVAGAYALERAGRRGPAEALLRRLAYGARTAGARPEAAGSGTRKADPGDGARKAEAGASLRSPR